MDSRLYVSAEIACRPQLPPLAEAAVLFFWLGNGKALAASKERICCRISMDETGYSKRYLLHRRRKLHVLADAGHFPSPVIARHIESCSYPAAAAEDFRKGFLDQRPGRICISACMGPVLCADIEIHRQGEAVRLAEIADGRLDRRSAYRGYGIELFSRGVYCPLRYDRGRDDFFPAFYAHLDCYRLVHAVRPGRLLQRRKHAVSNVGPASADHLASGAFRIGVYILRQGLRLFDARPGQRSRSCAQGKHDRRRRYDGSAAAASASAQAQKASQLYQPRHPDHAVMRTGHWTRNGQPRFVRTVGGRQLALSRLRAMEAAHCRQADFPCRFPGHPAVDGRLSRAGRSDAVPADGYSRDEIDPIPSVVDNGNSARPGRHDPAADQRHHNAAIHGVPLLSGSRPVRSGYAADLVHRQLHSAWKRVEPK
ncbi:hypothetical protein BN871_FB_00220 [Paenibacillus sp. P22]|nr:hypothetical protein BN871_FB_00220 [Paenibacillus sp. P22]